MIRSMTEVQDDTAEVAQGSCGYQEGVMIVSLGEGEENAKSPLEFTLLKNNI